MLMAIFLAYSTSGITSSKQFRDLKMAAINANNVVVFLCYACLKKISINNIFPIVGQKSRSTGLLDDIAFKQP